MGKLRIAMWVLLAGAMVGTVGCGDDDSDDNTGDDDGGSAGSGGGGEEDAGGGSGSGGGGSGGGGDVDGGGMADGGAPPTDCPAVGDREEMLIDGEIDADTTWSCQNLYILTDLTFVVGDSTLTIEPGTVIQGDPETALVITRGSELISEGTVDSPIVFTSSAEEGSRLSGDWGGVILLGDAPINIAAGENNIEGIDPTDD